MQPLLLYFSVLTLLQSYEDNKETYSAFLREDVLTASCLLDG